MPLPVEGFNLSEITTLNVASRRELFADRTVIDTLLGSAHLQLHRPVPHEVILVHDAPWEGNTCGYATVFRDESAGGICRMYYRGSGRLSALRLRRTEPTLAHRPVTCYAESVDGIRWTKPDLDLVAFDGSTENNVIWDGVGTHNFTPFLDTNPDCPYEARYKAVGGIKEEGGLFAFGSPDGIRWALLQTEPVITEGTFDSQNLAFWDPLQEHYRAYVPDVRQTDVTGGGFGGIRDVKVSISHDFLHWTEPQWLSYHRGDSLSGSPSNPTGAAPDVHLYTSQVMPYPRAPHLSIGFPTRFVPDRAGITDTLLMLSRDGHAFHRWDDALIPPGQNRSRWHSRSNCLWWGLIETASPLPGAEPELSLYASEHYDEAGPTRMRRYTTRRDGFLSVRSGYQGGQVLTKPLIFTGSRLKLNVATSAAGHVRAGLERPGGQPIEGLSLGDCKPFYGDATEQAMIWRRGDALAGLAGQTVRLRVELRDADLYAFQFS